MKFTKQDDKLIVELPITQSRYNPYMGNESVGEMKAFIGVIAGDEYTLNYLIDMDYKDKGDQIGLEVLRLNSKEELRELCELCDFKIDKKLICVYCHQPIWGIFTKDDDGFMCRDCADTIVRAPSVTKK